MRLACVCQNNFPRYGDNPYGVYHFYDLPWKHSWICVEVGSKDGADDPTAATKPHGTFYPSFVSEGISPTKQSSLLMKNLVGQPSYYSPPILSLEFLDQYFAPQIASLNFTHSLSITPFALSVPTCASKLLSPSSTPIPNAAISFANELSLP